MVGASDITDFVRNEVFRIVAVGYIVVGVVLFLSGDSSGIMIGSLGAVLGFFMLLSAVVRPAATKSTTARWFAWIGLISLVLLVFVMSIYYSFDENSPYWYFSAWYTVASPVFLTVAILTVLWPCMCLFIGRRIHTKVVGLAKSQHQVSIPEMAKAVGVPSEAVRDMLYEAIADGTLAGRIEGDTFTRAVATGTPSGGAVVLVICPYCGAKTEQGVARCQVCGAKL